MSIILLIFNAVLFSLPVFFLWNWLMPLFFAFPTLTIWQTLGFVLLFKFLTY